MGSQSVVVDVRIPAAITHINDGAFTHFRSESRGSVPSVATFQGCESLMDQGAGLDANFVLALTLRLMARGVIVFAALPADAVAMPLPQDERFPIPTFFATPISGLTSSGLGTRLPFLPHVLI